MKKNLAYTIIICFVASLYSCDLGFFKRKEIEDAFSVLKRTVDSANRKDSANIEMLFANSFDITFQNEDNTVIHKMNFTVDDEDQLLYLSGDCEVTDYIDSHSGQTVNGTVSYFGAGPINGRLDKFNIEMSSNVNFSESKIETLEYTMRIFDDGTQEIVSLLANGDAVKIFDNEMIFDFIQKGFDPYAR